MELVPKIPSERVIRAVQLAAVSVVMGLALSGAPAFWKIPAGIVALFFVRPIVRSRDLAIEGALDRFESVLVLSARSISVVALFAFVSGASFVKALALAAFVFAVTLASVALARDRARAKFLAKVYGGALPEFRVERDTEVQGFELLPPVLSGTITDAVIAHVAGKNDYRTSHGPRPLARVMRSHAKMVARLATRARAAVMAPLVVASCATLSMIAPWSFGAPVAQARPAAVAPACRDAVPYFEERLQAIPGVGRATLVARDHDGIVVYVPKTGVKATPELDATVLETARAIPCNDKLPLTLAQPRYVAFDVSAELIVDANANRAEVQRDAEEQVRALFQPDAHALDNEHFGFGRTEKTFGYRVRHALRHVSGVSTVKLVIDGTAEDAALEPTDFPQLKSLSIGVRR